MRAKPIVHEWLSETLGVLHAQRAMALTRVVIALLTGGKLWLSSLGRSLGCAEGHGPQEKHGIKAVDRLLGNKKLHAQQIVVYAALAQRVLGRNRRPIVLIDITAQHGRMHAITASLAADGRGIPLFSITEDKRKVTSVETQKRLLRGLKKVLPEGTQPILVTDAGFESPWFDRVQELGWDFVGRVRHRTKFRHNGRWVAVKQLHKLATDTPRSLGRLDFPKERPAPRRLVLSSKPKPKGRKALTTRGQRSRRSNDRRHKKAAREPWLLCTSLRSGARAIVKVYAKRMQIEQNYRDTKNHRWGWSLVHSRSRTKQRFEMLMLIAALATAVALATGCGAERAGHHRHYQANTVRTHRVISWFMLGLRMLQRSDPFITRKRFAQSLRQLCLSVQTLTNNGLCRI